MKCSIFSTIFVLCMCGTSLAGPILLATGFGEGTLRLPFLVDTMTFTSFLRLQYSVDGSIKTLDLFDEEAISVVRSNPPISVSSSVSSVAADIDFDAFTDALTNGREDFLFFFDPVLGLIAGGLEQDFLVFPAGVSSNVDLLAYQIQSIERDIVYDLTTVDGVIATDVHIQGVFSFYGTPVPEPSVLLLFLVTTGVFAAASKRGERSKC